MLDDACSSHLLRHVKALLVRLRQLHRHGATIAALHSCVVLQAVLDDASSSQLLRHANALLVRLGQLHWHGATDMVLRCCVVPQAMLGLLSAPFALPSILILCLQLPWCGRCEALSCTTIRDHLITPSLTPYEELQRVQFCCVGCSALRLHTCHCMLRNTEHVLGPNTSCEGALTR